MDETNKEYQYNRIVIVGNGLDLAMGLKTKYTDFLLDYLISNVEKAQYQKGYSDNLLSLNNTSQSYGKDFRKCTSIQEFLGLVKENGHWNVKYLGILTNIIESLSIENWVDVESLYFDTMIPLIENVKRGSLNKRDFSLVKEFNASFEELVKHLDMYIKKEVTQDLIDKVIDHYYVFMLETVQKQTNPRTCLNHSVEYKELPNPNRILFLNFNYTKTITRLINRSIPNSKSVEINIHGEAGNQYNPIIFGYGDDTHPYYAKMEEERSDEPLKFVKSFYYNRTTDYHQMLGFMDSGPYEVYIVGHSCGLSDRTLLKSIFEHDDCISIKIFHRGTIDEHLKKNMSISRHFDDKQLLRKRVLPFDKHAIIPQIIK